MAQLTAGAVNSMNNNITGIKPTLQLIDVKTIQVPTGEPDPVSFLLTYLLCLSVSKFTYLLTK